MSGANGLGNLTNHRNKVVDPSFPPEHYLTLLLKDLVAAFLLNNKQVLAGSTFLQ